MTSPIDDRQSRREYAAAVESIAIARHDAAGFVRDRIQSTDPVLRRRIQSLVERVEIIVSELSSNAVEAGPGQWFRVEITVDKVDDGGAVPGVKCSVAGPGTAAQVDQDGPAVGHRSNPLAERGRGLTIVRALSSRSYVERTDGEVVFVAELAPPEPV